MIRQLIKAEPQITIQRACRLLELPVSSHYYPSEIRPEDEAIKKRMATIFEDSFYSYGKRRLAFALKKESFEIGVFKMAKLMKTLGVVAKRPRKPHYYKMGKEWPTTSHLLKRAFNPSEINTRWVGDITYIRSHQGWRYLATAMDLANREVVGYALSKTPDAKLVKKALTNAIAMNQPKTQG